MSFSNQLLHRTSSPLAITELILYISSWRATTRHTNSYIFFISGVQEGEFEKNNPKHALTGLWFLSRKHLYLLRVPLYNAIDSGTSDFIDFRWQIV